MTPIVTADGTNYATLTIGGELFPVTDVVVSLDDAQPVPPGASVNGASIPLNSRVELVTFSDWTPAFQSWYGRLMSALGSVGIARYRPPRWLRLWQRRHEKAAAKRTKMRAARYAARWEQAHLRGEK